MDQAPEQTTALAAAEGFTSIAIKLPEDLQERILSFPFIHAIHERYPKAELHLITPKTEIEVLNLLPFKAYYHEFERKDVRHVFHVHRYCVQAKIYNVDLFVSLTDHFTDACLGLGLRAKTRLGYSDRYKGLVLTHKTPRPRAHHLTEDFFALYRELLGDSVDLRSKVLSRELEPVVKVWDSEPYIAVDLGSETLGTWAPLVSLFEGQRIVFFSSRGPEKYQLEVERFLRQLPKKNQYHFFAQKTWIDLAKMMAHARGVILRSGAAAALSAYTGTKTLILYETDPQRDGPFYFLSDVCVLGGKAAPAALSEVAERAQEFFRLA